MIPIVITFYDGTERVVSSMCLLCSDKRQAADAARHLSDLIEGHFHRRIIRTVFRENHLETIAADPDIGLTSQEGEMLAAMWSALKRCLRRGAN